MLVLQIILSSLLLWLLSGFLPWRTLRPKRGRWYYVGLFNQIFGAVNGGHTLPIIPLPWPFRLIKIELTWTEYQQPNEVYDSTPRKYGNVEKAIGTKTAFTNIRTIEEHPIEVEVTLSDGYTVNLIFDTTLMVYDPMRLVPVKQFLTYVQQEFSDIISPWVKKNKDIDSILEINIDEMEKNHSWEHEGEIINFREYLDQVKFASRGFCIKELSMKVGIPPEADEYFKIQNETKKEEAEKIRLKAVEERKEMERKIFTNDATTEREVQKADLAVTETYQKNIIKEVYDGKERVAAAYKAETLVINSMDTSKGDADRAKHLTDTMVGNLIVHKRLPSNTTPKPSAKQDDSTTNDTQKKKGD